MNWVLIIWLGTSSNYTVYQEFKTVEQCIEKQTMVQKALQQADSKMNVTCRKASMMDKKQKGDIIVQRYVFH
jgi:hypothetical protein